MQSKVFAATFAVGFTAELIGEIMLYRTIPSSQHALQVRFWSRYVIAAACAIMVGLVGYIVVKVLSGAGWTKLAWALTIVPTVAVLSASFAIQGVSTALDETSGTSFFELIAAAFRAKKSVRV